MAKWLILIGVILMLCIAEWMREIFTFKITHYHIVSDKLNHLKHEKRIVFLCVVAASQHDPLSELLCNIRPTIYLRNRKSDDHF